MVSEETVVADNSRIACKLVYLLKRYTDEWIANRLCCGNVEDFNTSQLPLFMSISCDGVTNNALAEKLNISKQASSKVIKELETAGLVQSDKSPLDARAVLIQLTPKGKKLYAHIKRQIMELEEQYKQEVGPENYEMAINVMMQLIGFHERQKNLQ